MSDDPLARCEAASDLSEFCHERLPFGWSPFLFDSFLASLPSFDVGEFFSLPFDHYSAHPHLLGASTTSL